MIRVVKSLSKTVIPVLQPTNDVYKVSREDLILGLRGCLSASEKFSPFCLPMLLEKATSSVPSAKLDALQTLVSFLYH